MATSSSTTQKPKTTANMDLSRKIRPGFVSHTELASSNPPATKQWGEKTFGWSFGEPMTTPQGPYHSWKFEGNQGGGIRGTAPGENPGTIPYAEVEDIKASFKAAVKNGAKEMVPPTEIPGGNGWIAVVQAPGGVPIGLWGTK